MISKERHLPSRFDPQTGENVRWSAELGTESHSTAIVSGGRVYVGTNNANPRDPKHTGDSGVLMCFDEADGRFLWQMVVPKREEDPYLDWPKTGLASPPTVEGNRVYIVSNRGEVVCLDARGMSNGNDGPYLDEGRHVVSPGKPSLTTGPLDADILWVYDMVSESGIWTHDGAHSSILVDGNYLYVNTGTGVDNTHRKIRTPDAPSLIVLDKRTGRCVARDREGIAPTIFHATWSSPSIGRWQGRKVIFFAGGNGVVYAFEPIQEREVSSSGVATLKRVWQFDFDPAGPKQEVHRFTTNRREGPSNIYGMPVTLDGRLYIAGGGDLWWGKNEAWLRCVSLDGRTSKAGGNPGDVVWTYALERHTLSTVAISKDLAYIADTGKWVHCVDIRTGKACWTHEAKGDFWSSPMVADGKGYIGSRRGDFMVFADSREKQVLCETDFKSPISGTATPANGAVYVVTMNRLYCLANGGRGGK